MMMAIPLIDPHTPSQYAVLVMIRISICPAVESLAFGVAMMIAMVGYIIQSSGYCLAPGCC